MILSGLIYNDVTESFRMEGTYLGTLKFKGKLLNRKFLTDGEKLSQDKRKVIECRYILYETFIGSMHKLFMNSIKENIYRNTRFEYSWITNNIS